MKKLRQIHLYLGCFFTPMLLFFVISGWFQTFNPGRLKSASEAETLIQKLRVVHTDQIYPADQEFKKPSSPKVFQWFVGLMSAAMLATTVIGVLLAIRFGKSRGWVLGSLLLGVLIPVVILRLGQQR